jgi:mercuric ion binding protein
MKSRRIFPLLVALGLGTLPIAALAAETTVMLDVHHAGCVLCGPIVKSALAHVQGVKSVAVSQPNGMADVTATVSYNPAMVKAPTLVKVLTNRGYPARIIKIIKR